MYTDNDYSDSKNDEDVYVTTDTDGEVDCDEEESAEESNRLTQKPSKLLVVDEQDGARKLLKRRLSIYGHEVSTAASAKDAFKVLEAKSIDVIFSNVLLPDISGLEFLQQLKSNSVYKRIPIIMISSDDDIEIVVKCIEFGAEDYLVKPLNQTLMRARLANCLAKKEADDKEIAYLAKIEKGQKQIEAQEKMASVGMLVSSISQELKNPLNFVINFAAVSSEASNILINNISQLKDSINTKLYNDLMEQAKLFQSNTKKISEYGQNADRIIRFMLDQSSSTGGKKHPEHLKKIIQQTITMFISAYKNNGVTVFPEIIQEFDETIDLFPLSVQAISKAIYNILDNAIYAIMHKYEDASNGRILIQSTNLGSKVEIKIRDNGTGIQKDILYKIFSPFFTTKTEGLNTGLGLSTVKEVVSDHGGEIFAESVDGEYAEFIFTVQKTDQPNQEQNDTPQPQQ